MARPIPKTPILTARDVPNFFQQMKTAEAKKTAVDTSGKIQKNAEQLKTIFK